MKNAKILSITSWLGFLLLLLWMTSCGSQKDITKTVTTKDSTFVKTTITPKDTTIIVPGAKVRIEAQVGDLSEKPITKKENHLTASLSKVGTTIIADCNSEQYEMVIQLQNQLIESYRQREMSSSEEIRIPVKYIPKFIRYLSWVGGITLILIVIIVCIKLFKKSTFL